MVAGRLRVRLKSYDHRVIDEASAKIVDTVLAAGSKIVGPIPLPTERHMTLEPNERTIDALSNLDLAAGVSIEIKM